MKKAKKKVAKKKVAKKSSPLKTTLRIWTRGYQPFIMGGDVHAPVGTDVEVGESFSLGKGYRGYVITAPDGSTVVAEGTTGAIVGDSLSMVRGDIAEADLRVMKQQMQEAQRDMKRVRPMKEGEFWKAMGKV